MYCMGVSSFTFDQEPKVMYPDKIIPYLRFCVFGTNVFLYLEICCFAICANCFSIYLRVLQIVNNDVYRLCMENKFCNRS